eukprot:19693_1
MLHQVMNQDPNNTPITGPNETTTTDANATPTDDLNATSSDESYGSTTDESSELFSAATDPPPHASTPNPHAFTHNPSAPISTVLPIQIHHNYLSFQLIHQR